MESDVERDEEVVVPTPTGMTVFSTRLPAEELGELRREAGRRGIAVSELIRAAVRGYLSSPPVLIAISATAEPGVGLQVITNTPGWEGGRGTRTENDLPARLTSIAS